MTDDLILKILKEGYDLASYKLKHTKNKMIDDLILKILKEGYDLASYKLKSCGQICEKNEKTNIN